MEVEEILRKLKPILGEEKLKPLWMEYLIYPEQRREIEGLIKALKLRYLDEDYNKKSIYLVPPSKDTTSVQEYYRKVSIKASWQKAYFYRIEGSSTEWKVMTSM